MSYVKASKFTFKDANKTVVFFYIGYLGLKNFFKTQFGFFPTISYCTRIYQTLLFLCR